MKTEILEPEIVTSPDKAKLQSLANSLRHHPMPTFGNIKIGAIVAIKIEELAKWIEAQIERL
jgi:hypothetical protein